MLYFDRIDVSGRINSNKTSVLKTCNIFHYWYFLHKGFKFQPHVINGCHDILMMSNKSNDTEILSTNSANTCCIINGIHKK